MAAAQLKEAWGGATPSWAHFKSASKAGNVRTNRTIALEAGFMAPVPTVYTIGFGVITMWAGFLSLPLAIVAALLGWVSWWMVLASIIAAGILTKIARAGLCKGVEAGAARDEAFYNMLAESGAFLFSPADSGTGLHSSAGVPRG